MPLTGEKARALAARFARLGIRDEDLEESFVQSGGKAEQVQWTPPAGGDRDAGLALARLVNHSLVEAATRKAFERYLQQFTPEVTTRQIERCFETTIEAHRSRGPIALARAK